MLLCIMKVHMAIISSYTDSSVVRKVVNLGGLIG